MRWRFPSRMRASMPSCASSASCSFRTRPNPLPRSGACSPLAAATRSASGTHIVTTRSVVSHIRLQDAFSRPHPPQFYSVPFSCHQIDPIKEFLIEAGFTGINAAVVSLDKVIPDVAGFARAAVYGNPLIDQIRSRGGVEPELVVEALVQEYRREFGADPGRMPLQAVLFSGTKRS